MKIAIYSLTRDRLAYTKKCFASLQWHAGINFHHYVVDNGSNDSTVRWLEQDYKPQASWYLSHNCGISVASNLAVKAILASPVGYTHIVKYDNDCLCTTPAIFDVFKAIYATKEAQRWVLAPRVTGINRQPTRVREHVIA